MSDDKRKVAGSEEFASRRAFLGKFAVGAAAVGVTAACGEQKAPAAAPAAPAAPPPAPPPPAPVAEAAGAVHVKPGTLDDYYGFWSGGQSGELRVLGIPSMREIKRIPVFNRDSATGWGGTDWSKELLKGRHVGDTHHVHLSYTGGTYDGRWIFVNDKVHARLARVDIESMEVDAIVDIPNSQGTHGIFPQRHKTGYVVCNAEYRTPQPNDGTGMDDPSKYGAMHTVIDGEKMQVAFQVLVEGNMDLAATDYEGKYSFATCYNLEGGVTLEQMMAKDQDCLYVFNLPACEKAVAEGKTIKVGDFDKVLDARGDDGPLVIRIPVPKSPHGVNISPDGKYAIVAGKLSPTASVVDISKIADAFAGKIKPRDCVVAEPELGLGPLHTAFDGKGTAYTSIFIDSVVCKWSIEKAIAEYGKDKPESAVLEKLDVNYQIGHINASMSETKDADGKWLIALCKFSKDRFLNVGPLHMENDQLIDISGEKMELVHDGPAYPEPHDAVIVKKDLIHPKKQQQRTQPRFAMYAAWAKEDGVDLMRDNKVVERPDGSVRVYMTSMAPKFGMNDFRVKSGQTVQVIVTNIDKVEDLSHGFSVDKHDICMLLNPQDTNSYTFTAGAPGLYWYYCPWFCHALHLEMRGRMFVDPKA
ncbi:MAG: nitrous-oxide reductase [Deltaproteobacteria bacterium]|nr:nitrous-oxide reductase [Deltaproteobacteria bacterium]